MCRIAASVSAVSPDCDTNTPACPATSGGSRYRNSDATSQSTGSPASRSNQYFPTSPA
jgi:hypothetical protein